MSESKRPRGKYKTTNWADYNASLKARGSLTVWLDKDMQWYATVSGKRGRQRTFSDAAIQFCLSIKCLFGLALRQSLGLVESLLRLAGLDWRVPDFSTVCRRQKDLSVKQPYRPSTTALDLLVDSTGIKFLGEGEWKCKKHGAEYRRQWRKVHLAIDARTLDIRAIEVTDNGTGDAPMLPELLSQIPPDEPIASVGGDGAYDTKACHAAIALRNAQAIIPPRKNARAWKGTQAGANCTAPSMHFSTSTDMSPVFSTMRKICTSGTPGLAGKLMVSGASLYCHTICSTCSTNRSFRRVFAPLCS